MINISEKYVIFSKIFEIFWNRIKIQFWKFFTTHICFLGFIYFF